LRGSSKALTHLAAAGYRPIWNFEVGLAKPGGGCYVVEEFYFVGPDNLLIPVVVRPEEMPSIAAIDPASGLGGPAYGGITVADVDREIAFHRAVLGLEMRRDLDREPDADRSRRKGHAQRFADPGTESWRRDVGLRSRRRIVCGSSASTRSTLS